MSGRPKRCQCGKLGKIPVEMNIYPGPLNSDRIPPEPKTYTEMMCQACHDEEMITRELMRVRDEEEMSVR